MKERIRQIMVREAMSQQDFASTLGISPATLSSILNGRTNPSNNLVQAVHRAFPKINISWLMFGEGTIDDQPSALGEQTSEMNNTDVQTESRTSIYSSSDVSSSPILDMGFDDKATPQGDLFTPQSHVSPVSEQPRKPQNASSRENVQRVSPRHETSRPVFDDANPQMRNIIDIPRREIREIRVFYSDGTYETFGPTSSESAYLRKK